MVLSLNVMWLKKMHVPEDIKAEMYFLSTEEGGRSTPVYSGYRSQFRSNDKDWVSSHAYPDVEATKPGETARAYIELLSQLELLGKIDEELDFVLREGIAR